MTAALLPCAAASSIIPRVARPRRTSILERLPRDGFGIARDLLALELNAAFTEAWERAHESIRVEHDRREASKAKDGVTTGVGWETAVWVAQPYRLPPLPARFTERALFESIASAPALFDADELYVAPSPGVLGRIAAALGVDPYKPTIAALVESRDEVRSPEIEAAVGDSTPQGRSRIAKAMRSLGFIKAKIQRNGERYPAFIRSATNA